MPASVTEKTLQFKEVSLTLCVLGTGECLSFDSNASFVLNNAGQAEVTIGDSH